MKSIKSYNNFYIHKKTCQQVIYKNSKLNFPKNIYGRTLINISSSLFLSENYHHVSVFITRHDVSQSNSPSNYFGS